MTMIREFARKRICPEQTGRQVPYFGAAALCGVVANAIKWRKGICMKRILVKINVLVVTLGMLGGLAQGADVSVKRAADGWQLMVDGQPFIIKGVGCNRATGDQGEDYLKMAKEMGANAVRTWGETTVAYLDRARDLDLKVAVGFWLNPVRPQSPETYQSPKRLRHLKNQIMKAIRSMKKHPAVLIWIVGVEVFSHTDDPAEKRAFGSFLKNLIDSIHHEDPHHPVVYATSNEQDLPDLTAYVPNVDIIGIDTYGTLAQALGWTDRHHTDKPTLVAEFGPFGAWDVQKDINGMPFDPSDALKAAVYESTWRQVEASKNRCFGGFAFVLGEPRNQDSVTWFNINAGALRRKAYWTLYRFYTGLTPPHPVPTLAEFIVQSSGGVRAGERFQVKAAATALDGGALQYHFAIATIFNDPLIVDKPHYLAADEQDAALGSASLKAPDQPGIYRVYVNVTDAYGNVAVADRSLKVVKGE